MKRPESVMEAGGDGFAGIMKKPTYDRFENQRSIETFQLRNLHPKILLGTASGRYAGWIGQIYTKDRYEGPISHRTNTVGGKSFVEKTLPIESVEEYFEHFRVLEIDYTFYSLLMDEDGKPTQNFHVLKRYRQHMKERDCLVLKVPQMISAQKLHRGGEYLRQRGRSCR